MDDGTLSFQLNKHYATVGCDPVFTASNLHKQFSSRPIISEIKLVLIRNSSPMNAIQK